MYIYIYIYNLIEYSSICCTTFFQQYIIGQIIQCYCNLSVLKQVCITAQKYIIVQELLINSIPRKEKNKEKFKINTQLPKI